MTQLDSYARAPRQQTAMATAPGSQFSGHFSAQFDRQSAGFSASHSAVGLASQSASQSASQFDSRTAPHLASSNMSVIDWDLMFKAVLMRLRTCVSSVPAATVLPHLQSLPTSMHETVLECAADLHRLHLDLSQQRLTR